MENWKLLFKETFKIETNLGDFSCYVDEWYYYIRKDGETLNSYFTYAMPSQMITSWLRRNFK